MAGIFSILSQLCFIYSIVCIVRIIITWFPKANFSKAGVILAAICDPYLNFFRRFRFLNFHGLDFSPALAVILLSIVSQLLNSIAIAQKLTVGILLAATVHLVWTLVYSIASFLIFLLIIRLIAYLIMKKMAQRNGYQSFSPVWDQIDRLITPCIYKVSGLFTKRIIPFTTALLITIIFCIAVLFASNLLEKLLSELLLSLPI